MITKLVEQAKVSESGWIPYPHNKYGLDELYLNPQAQTSKFRFFGEKQGINGIYDLAITQDGIAVFDASSYSKKVPQKVVDLVIKNFLKYIKSSDGLTAKGKLNNIQLKELDSQILRYLKLC